jgi:hypothetical protein
MIWSVQVLWEAEAVIREAITSSRRDYVSVSAEPNGNRHNVMLYPSTQALSAGRPLKFWRRGDTLGGVVKSMYKFRGQALQSP